MTYKSVFYILDDSNGLLAYQVKNLADSGAFGPYGFTAVSVSVSNVSPSTTGGSNQIGNRSSSSSSSNTGAIVGGVIGGIAGSNLGILNFLKNCRYCPSCSYCLLFVEKEQI